MTDTDALIELLGKATDSDLSDGGRYFSETCNDLTRCGHGDTGEYQHSPDGKLVEWLWNNRHAIVANDREVIALRAEIARRDADVRLAMQALQAFGETEEGVNTAYGILRDSLTPTTSDKDGL